MRFMATTQNDFCGGLRIPIVSFSARLSLSDGEAFTSPFIDGLDFFTSTFGGFIIALLGGYGRIAVIS